MKPWSKKLSVLTAVTLMCTSLAGGCADKTVTEPADVPVNEVEGAYAFVGKDMQNTYVQKVYEGFELACSESGVKTVYSSPDAPTAEKQIEMINSLIEDKAAGIAIMANDRDALESALRRAMDEGIKVISLDSAVNKKSRMVHIQQAAPEEIGRSLVRAAYDITGGKGAVAVLSATHSATNQNLWIDYMNKEYSENAEKYALMPLKQIVYGDDDVTKSMTETQTLLQDSEIKVIIAPTTVGMKAAGQVITETGSDVKLTGLGLPSEMAEYIESGVCPYMYLWNPVDIGYLSGYTLDALVKGTITGALQEKFSAGSMAEKQITADPEGGSEVVLGSLLRFDSGNIERWKVVY